MLDRRPCIILTRRRTGAANLYNLLAPLVPWQPMGHEPFFGSRSMGEVAVRFHAGDVPAAREMLLSALSRGLFFKHQYETETPAFNRFLLQTLCDCRYRAIRLERRDEAERLFSLIVSRQFNAWSREGITMLRYELRRRERIAHLDLDQVRQMVLDERHSKGGFDAELARHPLDTLDVAYEDLFRSGIKTLSLADELFAFAGAGARRSVLDDASLLRFVFSGEHHTLSLMAESPELREVYQVIQDTLTRPTPQQQPAPAPALKPAPQALGEARLAG